MAILMRQIHAAAVRLAEADVPSVAPTDDGEDFSPHWGATRDAMVAHLGRELTAAEEAALTLSRAYGRGIDELPKGLLATLWPNGNDWGGYKDWATLADALEAMLYDAAVAAYDARYEYRVYGTTQR